MMPNHTIASGRSPTAHRHARTLIRASIILQREWIAGSADKFTQSAQGRLLCPAMTHLHRHYVQHDECRFSGSSLRTYLVPGDWSNGIGVERGVCYVGEWQAAAVTARPLFQLSCYEQAFDARLAVSFAAAMLLNILGCKVVNGRAKDVSMVCWHCYSCRRHLFRCVIPAVTPGIGKHEPVQTSTGRR
jgi:hypothetical protein